MVQNSQWTASVDKVCLTWIEVNHLLECMVTLVLCIVTLVLCMVTVVLCMVTVVLCMVTRVLCMGTRVLCMVTGAVYGDSGAVHGDSGAVYGDCGAVYDVLNHLEGSTTYSSTEGTRVDKLFRGSGNSYVKSCINVYNNLMIFQCG